MLAEFIKRSGMTQTAFADQLGVSKSYLSTLISRRRLPSLVLAVTIERVTDGAVPATSWIPSVAPLPTALAVSPEKDAAA